MTYNKVYAVIGEERHIVLDPINYQYDIKQILVIQGETVPEYYEADICNVGDTATLTMVGTAADGVEIPDTFLQDGRNVLVYVVIPGSGGDVQTRYDITIPVDERAEREDIDPSEAEQQQIDSLINALNSGVGRAEAAAEAIQDMDVEAETLAAGSAASVEKTVDPETGAVTLNFGIPQGQKGNPGTPGQDGVTPDFRIGSVETLNPGQSATATITGTPAQPVLNLGIPQGHKGDPGGDSGTSDYTELENKPQINGHTLSGNQSAADLGLGTYSKPAGGIPKTDLASDVQASLGKADTALQTAPVTSVNSKTGAVSLDAGDIGYDDTETYQSGTVGYEVSELSRQLSDVKDDVNDAAPVIINTASGAIASFADGANNRQIRKIVGTIVPVQSGSGDPSPDNVRPISGWTGAVVTKSGINLLTVTNGSGIKTTWSVSGTSYFYEISGLDPNQDFTLSVNVTTGLGVESGRRLYLVGATSDFIDTGTAGIKSLTKKPNSSGVLRISHNTTALREEKYANALTEIQLEAGSTMTSFEEPKRTTLPINWQSEAGTIYGGTVTLNEDGSADVVADCAKWIEDGSREPAIMYTGEDDSGYITIDGIVYNYALFGVLPASVRNKAYNANTTPPLLICNQCVKKSAGSSARGPSILWYASTSTYGEGVVLPKDLIGSTKSSVAAYLSDHPLEFVYELATPQTYHFDNIGQLKTFLGTNNVWIDTGAITECDYPADTKLYIDSLTAPDEDMIADANIASGKYFTVNNKLYLSTSAIAAGATIIPGTNCTETNLAAALNALNT